MILFGRAKKCVRCGSRDDVKVVTYVRRSSDKKLSELWCRPCRRAKLVSRS